MPMVKNPRTGIMEYVSDSYSMFDSTGKLNPYAKQNKNLMLQQGMSKPSFDWFAANNKDYTDLNNPVYDDMQLEFASDPAKAAAANPTDYFGPYDSKLMAPESDSSIMNFWEGRTEQPGLLSNMNMGDWMQAGQAGAGALQNLYSIYQGNKMLDLARDQFGFNKRLAKTNLFNQAQTVNASMEDRQRMRNSMGVGLSTEDYMKKYGVRGRM